MATLFAEVPLALRHPWGLGTKGGEGLVIPAAVYILPDPWRLETHRCPFFSLGNNNNKATFLS